MGKFQEGHKKQGGKTSGTPNKTTKEAKEILNKILFDEIPNIKAALLAIKKKDEYKYLECLSKLFPFVIAKKTDVTSDDEALQKEVNINVISGNSAEKLKKFLNG